MNESLQEEIANISAQLIADGYTDVSWDAESELLMATDPDGKETAINIVVITNEGQFPDEG